MFVSLLVETIGDAYIVIAGGPEKCEGREGAERAALFALDCIDCVKNRFTFHDGSRVKIRAGIASGLVIAGVVGKSMPKFTLFGDTVTLASQLETTSTSMRVQCTDLTQRLLRDSISCRFSLEERRDGKVEKTTWWIRGTFDEGKETAPTLKRRFSRKSSDGNGARMTGANVLTDSVVVVHNADGSDEPRHENPKGGENDESCSSLDLADVTQQQHRKIHTASQAEIANLSWAHVYKSSCGDAAPEDLAHGIKNHGEVEPGRSKSFMKNIPITSRRRSNESNELSNQNHRSFGSMLSSVGSTSTLLDDDKGFDISSVYSKESAAFHNYWSRLVHCCF